MPSALLLQLVLPITLMPSARVAPHRGASDMAQTPARLKSPISGRSRTPQMIFGPGTLRFQGDAQRVAQFLQRDYVRRFRGWREAEWKLICGAEPLSFSDRVIDGGVRLEFLKQRSEAGGLEDDGSLEIRVRGNAISWTSRGGGPFSSRGKQEGALYELLVLEMQKGALAGDCKLLPGLYPSGLEKRIQLIDSACRYDRAGQYERFQKGE